MTVRAGHDELDPLWRALADPTRREILDLLRQRPRTTGELADAFPTSRFAVMKHLSVLAEAGLVISRRRWRERWNHLNAVPLQALYERWVKPYEAAWSAGLLELKRRAERPEQGDTMTAAKSAELGTLEVELEITIDAPPERVWKALVDDIGLWWRKDFIDPSTVAFVLEQRPGGRVYEDWGERRGRLWYTVVSLEPPAKLLLSGDFFAINCGGSSGTSLVTIILEPVRGERTLFKLTDSVFGRLAPGMAEDLTQGWQLLIRDALKPFAEASKESAR
jgi:DNA-binding transcriptional ArsR family regulator